MRFKSKRDIQNWLNVFIEWAQNDGQKHYLVFDDLSRGGIWTLMQYDNGVFTIHGRGEDYCDPEEMEVSMDELVSFLWRNRKAVHSSLIGV